MCVKGVFEGEEAWGVADSSVVCAHDVLTLAPRTHNKTDTKLTQQELDACKPVLDPTWVRFLQAAACVARAPRARARSRGKGAPHTLTHFKTVLVCLLRRCRCRW
jgi:hypothetical protein